MVKCKCCDNTTNGVDTCSPEHGYAWRYLSDKNLDKNDIKNIINVDVHETIKFKYFLWKENLTSYKKCIQCCKEINKVKRILNEKFSDFCSKNCEKEFIKLNKSEVVKVCLICGDSNCKKQQCSASRRELKKYYNNIEDTIKEIHNTYINTDIENETFEIKRKCFLNNLKFKPICPVCNNKYLLFRNNKLYTTCSEKCSNIYKYKKVSLNYIINYYLERNIDELYLRSLDYTTLYKIYNINKLSFKTCRACEKTFIAYKHSSYCSRICYETSNFKNLHNFNAEYIIENFKYKEYITLNKAANYFNCSTNTIKRLLRKYDSRILFRESIENNLLFAFNEYDIIMNDRTQIKPKELDLYFNSKRFAIEYNGLYWHSTFQEEDNDENKYRHLIKTDLANNKNIHLFHIFENEWLNNSSKHIWISIIKKYLNNTYSHYKSNEYLHITESDAIKYIKNNYFYYEGEYIGDNFILVKNKEFGGVICLICYKETINNIEVIKFVQHKDINILNIDNILLKIFDKNILFYIDRRIDKFEILESKYRFTDTEPRKYYINKKLNINKITETDRILYDSGNRIFNITPKSV